MDHVDWSFEDGKIVGKKIEDASETLEIEDLDPATLAPKQRGIVSNASIRYAIRADRNFR
jgi:hypothetical protein